MVGGVVSGGRGPLGPGGFGLGDVLTVLASVIDDGRLLHRSGMIQMGLVDLDQFAPDPGPLHVLEHDPGGFTTSPYHDMEFCG